MRQSISMALLARLTATTAALVLALALSGCGGGGGGGTTSVPVPVPPTPAPTYFDSTVYSTAAGASLGQASELAAVTQHQIVVNGASLAYTATTGHLTASNPTTGAAEASFFYVAYTLANRDPVTRPVTFFHNGGPGSATVWLHL